MQRLFAGVPVGDFAAAVDWYRRLFDRDPDVVAHEHEVLWRVTDTGWIYVIKDDNRAGHALVAILVADLDAAVADAEQRGLGRAVVTREGEGARKATLTDPDGNSVALLEVPS